MWKCLRNVLQNLKYVCLRGGGWRNTWQPPVWSFGWFQWISSNENCVFQTHSVFSFCINQGTYCVPLLRGNGFCLLTGHNINVYFVEKKCNYCRQTACLFKITIAPLLTYSLSVSLFFYVHQTMTSAGWHQEIKLTFTKVMVIWFCWISSRSPGICNHLWACRYWES